MNPAPPVMIACRGSLLGLTVPDIMTLEKKRGTGLPCLFGIGRNLVLRCDAPSMDRLVNSAEKPPGLFPVQLAVGVDLSTHEALIDKHLLESIPLVDEPATTLLTTGSNHRKPS